MRIKIPALLAVCLLVLFTGCPEEGEDLPFLLSPHNKLSVKGRVVRALCYIDVDKYNPLNALDYTLEDGATSNGIPFFDFVVLGAVELKKNGPWVYVDVPAELRNVLDQRFKYIVPFQRRGIKVLLGVTGGRDGVSFGSITEDDWDELARSVHGVVEQYRLDGVELYDANGAKSASFEDFPYPEGWFVPENGSPVWVEKHTNPDEKSNAWAMGGDMMNNFIWRLRLHLGDQADFPIIVREENHGKYLPNNVTGTEFTGRDDQLNYAMNPLFDSFGNPDNPGESCNHQLYHNHYAPLAINMEGDKTKGTVVPPLEDTDNGNDIFEFTSKFANVNDEYEDYALIYCHNLKPVSIAAAESFLDVPAGVQPRLNGKTRLTQAEYLSIVSQAVFAKDVVCLHGDRLKE